MDMDVTYSKQQLHDIDEFETQLHALQRGEIPEESFTAARLQLGIYGQRQPDKYMVRVKIPGGRLTRQQLTVIQQGLKQYSGIDFVNITTRQDIQFHFIELNDVPSLLRLLTTEGLTTREACGNTVRNITACSLAGICPNENVNVLPYVRGVMQHFLHHPLTQHLPRKFKMSFSGCATDCAQGLIHDLAVIAVRQKNRTGFKIMAGGGLGHKPHEAIVLEEFIEESRLLPCIEAVLNLHNRYSDRKMRAKSRIKFLVDKFGTLEFRDLYHEELLRTSAVLQALPVEEEWNTNFKKLPIVTGVPRQIVQQKQQGYVVVPVSVPLGDIGLLTLNKLLDVMTDYQLNEIRLGQDQNLLLPFVRLERQKSLQETLSNVGLSVAQEGDNVVTCPGNWTCRLGITSSRDAANILAQNGNDLRLRVSGCHNACAQPQTADIGLHGLAKRLFGKLVPYYRLHLGGDGSVGGKLGLSGPEIPTARINLAIARLEQTFNIDRSDGETFSQWVARKTVPFFSALLDDFIVVEPADLTYLVKDYGESGEFSVLPLGGGECAGVTQETVSAWIAEAKNEHTYCVSFINQNMLDSAIECCQNILRLTASSILHSRRIKGSNDLNQLADQLALLAYDQSKLIACFQELIHRLELEQKAMNKESLSKLFSDIYRWHETIVELEKNGKLDTTSDSGKKQKKEMPLVQVADFSYEALPSAFLNIKKLLARSKPGELVHIRIKSGNDSNTIIKDLRSLGYSSINQKESKSTNSLSLEVSNHMTNPSDRKKPIEEIM